MRGHIAALAVPLLFAVSDTVSAQERMLQRVTRVAASVPVVTAAPVVIDGEDDSVVTLQRLSHDLTERLEPIEQRFRKDERLRRAGAVVGLSAAALGALRGQPTLTFVGTHAVRLGLDRQLTTIRKRTGFVVEPSIGHRRFSVTATRIY
jgi:hypothetical protein